MAEESPSEVLAGSIPVEVLALGFIEVVFMSAYAALLWYVLASK